MWSAILMACLLWAGPAHGRHYAGVYSTQFARLGTLGRLESRGFLPVPSYISPMAALHGPSLDTNVQTLVDAVDALKAAVHQLHRQQQHLLQIVRCYHGNGTSCHDQGSQIPDPAGGTSGLGDSNSGNSISYIPGITGGILASSAYPSFGNPLFPGHPLYTFGTSGLPGLHGIALAAPPLPLAFPTFSAGAPGNNGHVTTASIVGADGKATGTVVSAGGGEPPSAATTEGTTTVVTAGNVE